MSGHSRNTRCPSHGFGGAAKGELYSGMFLLISPKRHRTASFLCSEASSGSCANTMRDAPSTVGIRFFFRAPRARRPRLTSGRLTAPVMLCKYPLARDRSAGLFSDVAAAYTHEHVPTEKIALPKTARMRGDCSGFLAWTPKD